ncbi:MAG: thiamine pyrophosphate-binding protein [Betaproteobacteria bacterium]|nr:thiamine pyrophosphate-binding protein [Betaproteobacteria bacterium]
MSKMSAGGAVIESLRVEGVRYVYGVVGSCMVEILDDLYYRQDIAWVGTRHEQGAAHMADGYARASGRVGICMATNGPGATNLTTGISVARLSHSALVAITGASMLSQAHRDSFQEIDQVAMFRPLTKWSAQIPRADRIPELFRHAFRIAASGKKGPVHLDIPRDILNEDIDVELLLPRQYRDERAGPAHPEAVTAAAGELLRAKRPVVIAGLGVGDGGARAELLKLAEMLSAAIVTSFSRHDVVPIEHPLVIGPIGFGGSPEARAAVQEADLILAAGTRLGHITTFYDQSVIPAEVPILQIEIDPKEVGRNYSVKVGLVGDARETLNALVAALRRNEGTWPRNREHLVDIAHWKRQRAERLAAAEQLDTVPIKPRRVYAELRKVLPRDAIVCIDGGTSISPAWNMLDFNEPRSLFSTVDLGCLGFAYPASIGAKMAAPSRPVLSINGDGAFLMNGCEIETAVRCKVPVVALVLNNNCWGSEKAYQKYFFGGRYVGCDLTNPRFDKFAELFGGRGFYVDRPGDINQAVAEALKADVPSIVEIKVDPDELQPPARADAVKKNRRAS